MQRSRDPRGGKQIGLKNFRLAGRAQLRFRESGCRNTSVKCPRDGEEIITKLYEGQGRFHVEICPKCHGIWFDQGELNRVLPELTIRIEGMKWKPAPASHHVVISPKSSKPCEALQLDVADGLIVDRDPETGGFWVDGDEVEHLKQFATTACQDTRDHVDYIAQQMMEMGYHH